MSVWDRWRTIHVKRLVGMSMTKTMTMTMTVSITVGVTVSMTMPVGVTMIVNGQRRGRNAALNCGRR